MADSSSLASDLRGVVATLLAGAGGLLVRDIYRFFKRRRDAKRRREQLLEVLADAARFQMDLIRSQERMTATGKIRAVTAEELAQKQGQFQERRKDIARRLWEAQGNDERRGAKDVLSPEDLEDDER